MELDQIAVPFVYLLIFYLGYPSQWLLLKLEPTPLTRNELILSNVLLVCIFITYTKSVYVDAGRIPKTGKSGDEEEKEPGKVDQKDGSKKGIGHTRKWCRRCDAAKPPRAHHCKQCKRCIPKMDHHCPWTANCVSHTTFPHFIRFLFYASWGLGLLEYFMFIRISHLWTNRDLPAYLGPSAWQITHVFITLIANSITLFGLFVLLIRNIWCLLVNTTTIEGWEIERHKTLVRRARHFGGYLEGPDGEQVRIQKQEFPYDIGFWANVKQGMGTGNPISWFNPFGGTPPVSTGISFPTNEFNDPDAVWPPPDPDRSYRRYTKPSANTTDAFTYQDSTLSPQDSIAAFRQRQAADEIRRRKPFVERIESKMARMMQDSEEQEEYQEGSDAEPDEGEVPWYSEKDGEEGWRNSEGERLQDFGVDEDVEFYDEQKDDEEDDLPLSELIARRKMASGSSSAYAYE